MSKRPTVLLDVDGVIANFLGATLNRLNAAGKEVPYTEENWPSWDIAETIPQHKDFLHKIWSSKYFCTGIPPYNGAVEGVLNLTSVADVYFVTAPAWYSEYWMDERYCWLEYHFKHKIPIKDRLIFTRAKHLVQGDIFVDDNYKHVMDHPNSQTMDKFSLLWSRPYNKFHQTYCPVVRNWDELYSYAKTMRSPSFPVASEWDY